MGGLISSGKFGRDFEVGCDGVLLNVIIVEILWVLLG